MQAKVAAQSTALAADVSAQKLLPSQAGADQQYDTSLTNLIDNDLIQNGKAPGFSTTTFDGLTKKQVSVIDADLAKEAATVKSQIQTDGISSPAITENKINNQETVIHNDEQANKLSSADAAKDKKFDENLLNLVDKDLEKNSTLNGYPTSFLGLTAKQVHVIDTDLSNEQAVIKSQLQ